MAKIKELTLEERISVLEKRVAEKVSNTETKIIDHNGRRLGSVKLRLKRMSKGLLRFYLDIYRPDRGKKREYVFLDSYLNPSLVNITSRTTKGKRIQVEEIGQANEIAIANAETSRAEYFSMIRDGRDIKAKEEALANIGLIDWMEEYRELKLKTGQSKERALSVEKVIKHLKIHAGDKVKLSEVDDDFCKGFIGYLSNATSGKHTKNDKQLASSTANVYFQIFNSALNEAVREKKIPANPVIYLSREDKKPIRAERSNRTFLTIDEVKKLAETDIKNDSIKRAFLFACFTGLRISDIRNLTWSDIVERNGACYISIIMQKTREPLTIKLNKQAVSWLPHKGRAKEVFDLPFYNSIINDNLKRWAKLAGIEKSLCFHMSRHTFATMELTLGADLYVVSKLLGHHDLSVTQVYADIINKKREEAVDLMDKAFASKPQSKKRTTKKNGRAKV